MVCLNKYIKMLMKILERLWLRVSKLQEAQFYLPTGMKLKKKIMKVKIDQKHLRDKNIKNKVNEKINELKLKRINKNNKIISFLFI